MSKNIRLTIAAFVVSFSVFGLYVHFEKAIDSANSSRQFSYQLADQLRQSSDDLTRMVVLYVGTGDPQYKKYYQEILDIRDGRKPIPDGYFYAYWDMVLAHTQSPPTGDGQATALLDLMRQSGFTDEELGKLTTAKANSDGLAALEFEAIKLAESGGPHAKAHKEKALSMLLDDRYHQAKAKIMQPINEFYVLMDKRTADTVLDATNIALLFRLLFIATAIGAIFILWRTYVALYTTLGGSVDEISAHIAKIGHGDFSTVISVTNDTKDSVRGWLSVMQNKLAQAATELRMAERAALESSQRTQAILNNVLDGIITIDERGNIESFNKSAQNIFGYTAVEVIGRNVKMLMPEPYQGEHDGYLHNYISTGQKKIIGIGRQVVGQRKDGSTFPMDLAVSEMQLNDKRMFTGIVRDITERVKVERMKSEFISTVSHELRTPLTSIRGSLALIVGGVVGELPAAVKPLVDIAQKNSERLILLVNDILDIEKIESGNIEFDMRPLKLMPLLEQALENNHSYAEQYQVSYVLEQSAENLSESLIKADANRLLQVLTNLLSNAAKFSHPGGKVAVAVERSGALIRIAVKDNGGGVPDEFRERIFQKFAQADASDTRKKGGSGLGLSITKAIVEQMSGNIGFDSQPDVLTTFYVEFSEISVDISTLS